MRIHARVLQKETILKYLNGLSTMVARATNGRAHWRCTKVILKCSNGLATVVVRGINKQVLLPLGVVI